MDVDVDVDVVVDVAILGHVSPAGLQAKKGQRRRRLHGCMAA